MSARATLSDPANAQPRADRVLTLSAVVISLISVIALALTVMIGLAAPPSPPLFTWISLAGFPLAFILLVVVLLRAVQRRRNS